MLISVSDTGVGLPAGRADEIFNAFFTTKPQGSGMGLAISKSIVESHGGWIWANGDGGRGATFHFTLPAARAETNSPGLSESSLGRARFGNGAGRPVSWGSTPDLR